LHEQNIFFFVKKDKLKNYQLSKDAVMISVLRKLVLPILPYIYKNGLPIEDDITNLQINHLNYKL